MPCNAGVEAAVGGGGGAGGSFVPELAQAQQTSRTQRERRDAMRSPPVDPRPRSHTARGGGKTIGE